MKLVLVPALALGALAVAPAAPVIWSLNDHAYEMITLSTGLPTYAEAKAAAEASSFRGVQGRLLVLETPTYADEFAFVRTNAILPNAPLTGYWVGATRPNGDGDRRQGWTWEDGTEAPTSVTNGWNLDFFEGNVPSGMIFYNSDNYSTLWDYAANDPTNLTGGYIVEYASPVPEPATLAALGLGAAALLRRRRKS